MVSPRFVLIISYMLMNSAAVKELAEIEIFTEKLFPRTIAQYRATRSFIPSIAIGAYRWGPCERGVLEKVEVRVLLYRYLSLVK